MTFIARLKNRLIAKAITRFPLLSRRFVKAYRPWETEGEIPWTLMQKPLQECKVVLVTTAPSSLRHAGPGGRPQLPEAGRGDN